ncbi:hypothetical protein HPB47_012983 [Ixodes persulcatus]|uniref:Uncharacterized protein n=1 Tax=Ixodes persulcatus TaxID=34615 RepID=A0AC60NS09_IXOPE|nr:hypothetical protein HPB47_012983 [Ixodes persulcatus]
MPFSAFVPTMTDSRSLSKAAPRRLVRDDAPGTVARCRERPLHADFLVLLVRQVLGSKSRLFDTDSVDKAGWEREVLDERKIIEMFADVPAKDVSGFRAPFLLTGRDNGFRMLKRHLTLDSSLVHQRHPREAPFFPYTLDYGSKRACVVSTGPQDSCPGPSEVPLNVFFKDRDVDGEAEFLR